MHGFSGKGILAHGRNGYQGGSCTQVDSDRAGVDARVGEVPLLLVHLVLIARFLTSVRGWPEARYDGGFLVSRDSSDEGLVPKEDSQVADWHH